MRSKKSRQKAATAEPLNGTLLPRLEDRSYLAYLRPTPRPFLFFASGHIPAQTSTQPHSHPCLAMHGCLQGPLILCTSEGELTLEAGSFYLIGPGLRHFWRNDGRQAAATISFQLDASKPGGWPKSLGLIKCCHELHESVHGFLRFTTSGDQELHHSFWLAADNLTAEEPRDPLTLVGVLLAFLGQIKERLNGLPISHRIDSDEVQQIRRLLLAHVRDRLTISQIARELGLSATRAKELFRHAFGCGIMTYFNHLKIWQAKRLLNDPSLTVEQVSHQLGFSSSSYFSRAFVKHTGETPTGFRRQYQTTSEGKVVRTGPKTR